MPRGARKVRHPIAARPSCCLLPYRGGSCHMAARAELDDRVDRVPPTAVRVWKSRPNWCGPGWARTTNFVEPLDLNRVTHGPDRRISGPKPPQNHRFLTTEFRSADDSH